MPLHALDWAAYVAGYTGGLFGPGVDFGRGSIREGTIPVQGPEAADPATSRSCCGNLGDKSGTHEGKGTSMGIWGASSRRPGPCSAAWADFCAQAQASRRSALRIATRHAAAPRDAFPILTPKTWGPSFDSFALETRDTKVFPRFTPSASRAESSAAGDAADFVLYMQGLDRTAGTRCKPGRRANKGTRARLLKLHLQGFRRPDKQTRAKDWAEACTRRLVKLTEGQRCWASAAHPNRMGALRGFSSAAAARAPTVPTTAGTRKLFVRKAFDRWEPSRPGAAANRADRHGQPRPLRRRKPMVATRWNGRGPARHPA